MRRRAMLLALALAGCGPAPPPHAPVDVPFAEATAVPSPPAPTPASPVYRAIGWGQGVAVYAMHVPDRGDYVVGLRPTADGQSIETVFRVAGLGGGMALQPGTFAQYDQRLIVGDASGEGLLFYPKPSRPSRALSASRPSIKLPGRGALFAPDGSLFVAYGPQGAAVHDGRTGAVLRPLALARPVSFAAMRDGHLVAVGDGAAVARLSDGVILFDQAGEAAAVSHRRRYAAVLRHHNENRWREVYVQVFDLATATLLPPMALGAVQRASDFFDLNFTPSDDKLSVVRRGTNWREEPVTVGVIELATGRVSKPSARPTNRGVPASSVGDAWARIAKKHGSVVAPPRKLVPSQSGPGRNARTYAQGEDGLVLFSGQFDASSSLHQVSDLQLVVVDPESGALRQRLALPEPKLSSYSTLDLVFDPTGRFLRLTLGGEEGHHRYVIDVGSGATLHLEELADRAEVDTWQFSSDGTMMFNDASLVVLEGLRKLRLPNPSNLYSASRTTRPTMR